MAASEEVPADRKPGWGSFGVPIKTLGGLQFWTDIHFFHDWRIQKNVFTGHCRLLDGKNYRHAWGTFSDCLGRLEEIRREQQLPPMSGRAVVLVHGIVRTSQSMKAMREPFEQAGYRVFSFGYPSTQITIEESADLLHRAVSSLEGIQEINFVVHSMGGLVVRAMLAKHEDKRIRRIVMLGVPNLGAHMADRLKGLSLYRAIFGPAGQQLVTDPDGLIAKLPAPKCEFAIIAGARGTENGYNPLIPGDDDGTVALSSTRLPGAADFMTVSCLHSFLMYSREAIEAAVRFIQTGCLRASGQRQPIPDETEPRGTGHSRGGTSRGDENGPQSRSESESDSASKRASAKDTP